MRHRPVSGRRLLATLAMVVLVVAAGCAGALIRSVATTGKTPTAALAPLPGTAGRDHAAQSAALPPTGLEIAGSQIGKGAADANGSVGAVAASGTAPQDDTLVVKTGTLDLEVKDLGAALGKARSLVAGLGGYIGASQQSNQGDQQVATVTYRIPADRWDAAIDGLTALGTRVVNEQMSAVEVTGQVLDLGARIDNLRATEQALQAIMARAVRIQDVLDVQQQLTEVQGQIEQLSTEKAHLEQQAAYGSLTTTYTVPVLAVTATAGGWDPRTEIDHAMAQLLELAQGAATALIWFGIVVAPLLVVAVLVLLPFAWLIRRLATRSRAGGMQSWGAPPAGSSDQGA